MVLLSLLQLAQSGETKAQGRPRRVLNEQHVEETCGQARHGSEPRQEQFKGKAQPRRLLAGEPVDEYWQSLGEGSGGDAGSVNPASSLVLEVGRCEVLPENEGDCPHACRLEWHV